MGEHSRPTETLGTRAGFGKESPGVEIVDKTACVTDGSVKLAANFHLVSSARA